MYHPGHPLSKKVEHVLDVLKYNHTNDQSPTSVIINFYPRYPPKIVQLEFTVETVTYVAQRISGVGGGRRWVLSDPTVLGPVICGFQHITLEDFRGVLGVFGEP